MADESAEELIEPTGVGRILTASGTIYEIDFDHGTLWRLPVEVPSLAGGLPVSLPLRRDGDILRILQIITLRLHRRAVFLLEPLGRPPVVFTRRSTTPVVAFESIETFMDGRAR